MKKKDLSLRYQVSLNFGVRPKAELPYASKQPYKATEIWPGEEIDGIRPKPNTDAMPIPKEWGCLLMFLWAGWQERVFWCGNPIRLADLLHFPSFPFRFGAGTP